MLNCNRRTYSYKTVLVAQRASGFSLAIEPKNIILRRVSIFEFFAQPGSLANITRRLPLDWSDEQSED
jgi:hypothetical protein